MQVVMIVDGAETYPPLCPFGIMNSHHSAICGHPELTDGRKSLYCNYINDAGQWVDAPCRCPLLHESKVIEVKAKI